METADWIQAGLLFVTIVALIIQQTRLLKETRKKEARTANKLTIFFLCQDTALKEEEIIQHFRNMQPGKELTKLDETELKKTIYEMLRDQTLRYRTNGTFRARRNKAVNDNGWQ